MILAQFDSAVFLRDYWQKKPCLIRNPWADWQNPLSPDQLAGLAGEEIVESRFVSASDSQLQLRHGPFDAGFFDQLDPQPWTLLVQAVDHHIAEVAALLRPFRFIPNWRIDDVMVSLANDGGGVGPHFDQYDVFLIQGHGQRLWQLGGYCDQHSPLQGHQDLRLLADFAINEQWILQPGDMLYVPPGIAHNGIAVGDECMTYSVGFRVPSQEDLIGSWCDDLLAGLTEEIRYCDPQLPPQENPGEISAAAIDKLHGLITDKLADRQAFARWFGAYNSTPKYPEIDWTPEEQIVAAQVAQMLAADEIIGRNPASRFAFHDISESLSLLFVDGETVECTGPLIALAKQLCADDEIEAADILDISRAQPELIYELLAKLINQGSIGFSD